MYKERSRSPRLDRPVYRPSGDETVQPEGPAAPEPIQLRSLPATQARPSPVAFPVRLELPRPLTSLIGRETEVASARDLLLDERIRLLTLIGPGGVGKTRLALQVAAEAVGAFAEGVVFVPLAAMASPELVMPAIAQALGLREVDACLTANLVADVLRDKQVLLLLDNFEQVRPAAVQVAALLAACPGVVALVTSRVSLRVAGEQRFPVVPLALPTPFPSSNDRGGDQSLPAIAASPAVQLFAARAQAVEPRFALDSGNAAAIAAICGRVDGLPLAIELAAARSGLLSPRELLARLDPALPLLTDGPEDAPDRLRAMRQTIAWSFDLLPAAEQALFRRLAIFVGGFTLEAAEAVGGQDAPSVLSLIASLIDKSLLGRIEGSNGESRFGMLETIREFGLEQLAASGEGADIAARHASWCVGFAAEIRRSGAVSRGSGLATLEAEQPNFRAALDWLLTRGEVTTALHLAGTLAEFWMRLGHQTEGRAWLERALAADDAGPTAARAEALVGLNMMLWPLPDYARSQRLLREAETVARAAGDAGALAYVRLHQGYVAAFQGDFDLAVAHGEETLTTAGAIPQRFSDNGALWLLAHVAAARRENDRAEELYDRLLEAARAGGDEISVANALNGKAVLALRRAQPEQALAGFAEAVMVCRGYGDRGHAIHGLVGVATTAVALGRPELAVRLLAAVSSLRAAMGIAATNRTAHAIDDPAPLLAAAQAALGEERTAAAWAAGAELSFDEAIDVVTELNCSVATATPDAPAATPAALTSRERDILRLVIDGKSDKEIAAALAISPRTVSNHLATVRAKLAAPSRSAAAAIAVRDRLL
jgi:predicted ATPase/DNA-binding CsgD family transcriptional regulator